VAATAAAMASANPAPSTATAAAKHQNWGIDGGFNGDEDLQGQISYRTVPVCYECAM